MNAVERYAVALRMICRHVRQTDDEWWYHPSSFTLDRDEFEDLRDIIDHIAEDIAARADKYDRANEVDSVYLLDEITRDL